MFNHLLKNIHQFLRYYFLVLLAGAFYGVSNNYPEYLWPFSIIGVFLFLLFIFKLKSPKTSFVSGILFGIIFLSISFLFVLEAYPLEWMGINNHFFATCLVVFTWLVVPLFMSIPFGVFSFLTYKVFNSKLNTLFKAIGIASLWVVAENLKAIFFTILFLGDQSLFYPNFTYHSLAYSLVWSELFSKLLPYGGMYIIIFLCLFVLSVITVQKNNKNWLLIFLIFIFSFQFFALNKKTEIDYLNNIKVSFFTTQFDSLSTRNINRVERYESVKKIFNNYKIINTELKDSDVIIFPENSYFISQSLNIKDTALEGFERSLFLDSGKLQGGHFLTYLKDGNFSFYEKQMLLPQGEYVSYWIKYFAIIFNQKNWIESFEKDKEGTKGGESFVYKTINFNNGVANEIKIGGLLCYEMMSPLFYRQQTESDANLLVDLASNGIFPNSKTLLNQTISMAKVRAIENNRFLIQSTNKNSSFVVNNKGDLIYVSNPNEISLKTINIPLIESKTFYTKYGDFTTLISIIVSIFIVMFLFLKPKHHL